MVIFMEMNPIKTQIRGEPVCMHRDVYSHILCSTFTKFTDVILIRQLTITNSTHSLTLKPIRVYVDKEELLVL